MLADLLGSSYFVERMGARNDGAWEWFIMARGSGVNVSSIVDEEEKEKVAEQFDW